MPKPVLPVSNDMEWLRDFPRFTPTQITLFGKPFKIADSLSFYYSYREIFLLDIYRFVTDNPNPYILDCGANCGASVAYFKKLYPKARVIAFEPDPLLFEILKANTKVLGLQDLQLINSALWHSEGSHHFISTGADSGHLTSTSNRNPVAVNTVPLSRYLDRPVDLLKIDVEGAEVDILTRTPNLGGVLRLFVEYHSRLKEPQRLHTLLSVLTDNGFRFQIQTQFSSRTPFVLIESRSGMDLQLNIFAYRKESVASA
jgi:FkbM family methyltransferase